MIKDNIKFYQSYDSFFSKCQACFKQSHLMETCTLINYIPDHDFIIKKYNFSSFQRREKNMKFGQRKKYNALGNLPDTQKKALKVAFEEEEKYDSGLSSDENDSLPFPSINQNVGKRQANKHFTNFNFSKHEILNSEEENVNIL